MPNTPQPIVDLIIETPYDYFLNITIVRLYSVYEKIGLLFTRIFTMPKENTFFKAVSEWVIQNTDSSYENLKQILKTTIESNYYKGLDMVRQQYVHGMDMAFQQYEGTTLSSEYLIVLLHKNLEIIFSLGEYLHQDFLIDELVIILPRCRRELEEIISKENPQLENIKRM